MNNASLMSLSLLLLQLLFYNFFFFFNNLRNAPDASVAMVDDERNTFYHHHGCVEAQSLRLVNAYLADKGVDGHQQVLLTVVGTLRVIHAVDDESESWWGSSDEGHQMLTTPASIVASITF